MTLFNMFNGKSVFIGCFQRSKTWGIVYVTIYFGYSNEKELLGKLVFISNWWQVCDF
jgi:hypothetical protein